MRQIQCAAWLQAFCLLLMLASCDPISSVEYNVHNMTGDTVRVVFHKEILTSPYQGYAVVESDSVTTHSDSDRVALLPPDRYLTVQREWHGLYREEQVVPAWRYIAAIVQGNDTIDPARWNNEALWHFRTKGGGFGEGESRYYDLWIRNQ